MNHEQLKYKDTNSMFELGKLYRNKKMDRQANYQMSEDATA